MSKHTPWGNISIRNKTLRLLEKANAIDDGPVRLSRVLDKLGFSYNEFRSTRDTQHILGAISHGDKKIFVNADESAQRKHLILSHEIGHAILHPDENVVDFKSSIRDDLSKEELAREREANVFAYELALPYPEFSRLYKEFDGDIHKLSEHFMVSPDDIEKRIAFLNRQAQDGLIEPLEH